MNPLGLLDPVKRRAALLPPPPPRSTPDPDEHSCVRCQRDFPCAEVECLGLTFTLCPPCREVMGLAA